MGTAFNVEQRHFYSNRLLSKMALDFVLPPIKDNEDGSWGPSTSSLPAQFNE
jgi:hypothetical protein